MSRVEPSPLRFGTAVVAATLAGSLGAGVAPVIVYGLAAYGGFSASAAGAVMSAELGAFALASLILARHLGHASRRRFAALGIAVAVVGQLLSAFVTSGGLALAAARVVAGLGAGAAAASASAAAAGARDPDRTFAAVGVAVGLLLGAVLAGLFLGLDAFGLRFLFLTLAAVGALALPWVLGLPGPLPADDVRPRGGAHRALALATLTALFLAGLAAQATWSLSGTLGENAGMPNEWLGVVLSASMLAGLGGAGAATWLGTRHGRALPLLGGITCATGAMVVIATTRSAGWFALAQVAWGVAYFFSIPYFLGLAAALDARGRWTAAATGVASIGTALAPAVAGRVFDAAGRAGLATLTCVCAVGALALLVPVLRRSRRAEVELPTARA